MGTVSLNWVLDGLLVVTLLWSAWRALASPDLVKAVVFFVAFGLSMALAWVRLDAPDVALAEAAIGAGLTGALLLASLARLRGVESADVGRGFPADPHLNRVIATTVPIMLVLVLVGLGTVILSLPDGAPGLRSSVMAKLPESGVGNPVTAVLLNFRGYDTLLEVIVLWMALLGVWVSGDQGLPPEKAPGLVLDAFARLLLPVLILVAAYLLWVGAQAPGGAFQAGSVLGAAAVLLLSAGWRLGSYLSMGMLRMILLVGPAVFVMTGFATLAISGRLLEYPPARAGAVILLLESCATVSIGATLAALFYGVYPLQRKDTGH